MYTFYKAYSDISKRLDKTKRLGMGVESTGEWEKRGDCGRENGETASVKRVNCGME